MCFRLIPRVDTGPISPTELMQFPIVERDVALATGLHSVLEHGLQTVSNQMDEMWKSMTESSQHPRQVMVGYVALLLFHLYHEDMTASVGTVPESFGRDAIRDGLRLLRGSLEGDGDGIFQQNLNNYVTLIE